MPLVWSRGARTGARLEEGLIPSYPVPHRKQSTFPQKVTEYQAETCHPKLQPLCSNSCKGLGFGLTRDLGSPLAPRGRLWKKKSLWALRSLQWRTLKAAGELGLLGPPPCWVGNALEVS